MLPDLSQIDAAVAGILAQVIPVLFLTLLFEVRVRPASNRRSALGIAIGFFGNLAVAVTAILLEFGLLGTVQHHVVDKNARVLWVASIVLFSIVLVRWIATTTIAKIVAANGSALRKEMAASTAALAYGFREYFKTIGGVLAEFALAPSQVVADILQISFRDLVAAIAALGQQVGSLVRSRWRR